MRPVTRQRFVVYVLPEASDLASASIIGTYHDRERAEQFLRRFVAKRGYLSGMVMDLLTETEARAEWEPGPGDPE